MAFGSRRVDRDGLMLLPPDLRDWLPPDHLAWLVLEVVDQLDLSGLEAGYRLVSTGREAYDPSMMTALLVYAYCCGARSSRLIERSCITDVAFRVITAQQRPDHSTIARFRAVHAQALSDLFGQVLAICARAEPKPDHLSPPTSETPSRHRNNLKTQQPRLLTGLRRHCEPSARDSDRDGSARRCCPRTGRRSR